MPKKVYVRENNSENYLKILNELYNKIQDQSSNEVFSAPFTLFCATSLEYLLNDLFIDYTSDYFHEDIKKRYAESFISMGLHAKLICILPIITGNKFQISLDSFEYKTICEIISKRNQIAHGKDYFEGLEPEDIQEDGSFSISLSKYKKSNQLITSKKKCEQYKEAFDSFYKHIFLAYDIESFQTSKFIIIMKKDKRDTAVIK